MTFTILQLFLIEHSSSFRAGGYGEGPASKIVGLFYTAACVAATILRNLVLLLKV
jgi:hypothetical protein